jgi:hypothetical protein
MLFFEKAPEKMFYVYASEGTKNYFLLNDERITTAKIQLNKGDKLVLFSSSKSRAITEFEVI